MKISFHGAARSVTGSKHLVTLDDGQKILLDCGMFQGMGPKTDELNEQFGFDPASISFLLLSHAHIDHSGLIPLLVKQGFAGKIFCTQATRELSEILLKDSAEIQLHETDRLNKERQGHNLTPYQPLYTADDVATAMEKFEAVEYDTPYRINENVTTTVTNAGHLIGSASIYLTVNEAYNTSTLLFSGDIGRYRSMLLQPPAPCEQADYIILETTYGDKMHALSSSSVDHLLKAIKKTCLRKKGKLIIPAFSVGRTQEILYTINQLELEKRLPEIPVFVDSPLSKKATHVIKHHMTQFNDRLQQILVTDDDPFHFNGLHYIETAEESLRLTESSEPCVIISSSGTADAGRVKRHIYTGINHAENTVLFVGYCPEHSLGGQLLAGNKTVSIFGEKKEVHAEVDSISSMSAHGDCDDLLRFLSCQDAEKVKKVFLVHGELAKQEVFASKLERKLFKEVIIPGLHEEFILSPVIEHAEMEVPAQDF